MNSFTGTLGDGITRGYSAGILCSPFGGMSKEQFGTTTPIYNKLFYNVRGQLAEIPESTSYTGPADTTWDRGAIINHYSNQGGCSGASCNATDNNGNLMRQEIQIPNSDTFKQFYEYDPLNRIQSVRENRNGGATNWQQVYTYDRYGNRRIDTNPSQTWGGVNNMDFELETGTNRLYAPGDLALADASRRMRYDTAGNLINDAYNGAGERIYDAENRMKKAWGGNNQWQEYAYDGDGRRVKRIVDGTETWQVYGLGGELLAEYAANGTAASPQKEYGYRNGQLLITATAGSGWGSPPVFANDPLQIGITEIRAIHLTELRDAINQLRVHAGLSAASWAEAVASGVFIKADHILELRTKLDEALVALSQASGGYSVGLGIGFPIQAIHLQELRDVVETAWSSSSSSQINWLVSDQLGTPRMIFDKTGSLAAMKRPDYLPFGEELTADQGLRTGQGYVPDNVRQKFTSKERDNETDLDYSIHRYYSSSQGRFTSVDPLGASAIVFDPQSFNRYTYVLNNPLKYVDPDGLDGHNPWASLTDEERKLLASKLTTVTGKDQMKAAGQAFNNMVTVRNKDGSLNEDQTNSNVASVQNFVGSLAGDSKVWDQIQSVDKVSTTGNGRQSDINFTVKNRSDFLEALTQTKDAYGKNRFIYMGNEMGHIDSTRELGYGVTDPSMHMGRDGPGDSKFGAHWDPSTALTHMTVKEALLDTAGLPVAPLGLGRRVAAAEYHWIGPRASTQAVGNYLKEQGLVPRH